ncbi:hypothetical protein BU17DRAFT_63782 [Hysterangium stoloniferum]|nr:hypothetical protein BU17DRAFT_63782 [Hysterangium stoloniferum]
MLASHKFKPRDIGPAESGIDYSPRKICVATTVVIGKIPVSFRELHRSGATSYYHNFDPGLVGVLNNKTVHRGSSKVYAVYGHNNKLRIVLGTLLALGALASIFVMSLEIFSGLKSSSDVFGYSLGSPGITVTAQRFWFGMLPSLINETILCFLMILKAIQNYRDKYRVPMLSRMIRDSIIYFASIFAALLVNCTIYYPGNHVEVQITVVWTSIISCTMGSRLSLTVSTDYQLIKVEGK